MNAPSPDHSQVLRRPRPSVVLIAVFIFFVLLLLTCTVGLAIFASRIGEYAPAAAALALAIAIALCFFTCIFYRAVFRARHGASVLGTMAFTIAAVLTLLLLLIACAATDFNHLREGDEWKLIAMMVLTSYFFLGAFQMFRWSERLRHYHTWKPFCGPCGYNLIGSIAAGAIRCPECGAVIPYEKTSRYRPPRSARDQVTAEST